MIHHVVRGGQLKATWSRAFQLLFLSFPLCLVKWAHKTKEEHETMQRKQIELE